MSIKRLFICFCFFIVCVQCHSGLLITCCPGARIEEFIYDKLDKKLPSKTTNAELLGQYMLDAANEFGPGTPYGQCSCHWNLNRKEWQPNPSWKNTHAHYTCQALYQSTLNHVILVSNSKVKNKLCRSLISAHGGQFSIIKGSLYGTILSVLQWDPTSNLEHFAILST